MKRWEKLISIMSMTTLLLATPAMGKDAPKVGFDDKGEDATWERFNDPTLDDLVARGLKGNPGLEAAKARLEMAQAQAKAQLAPLLPSISAEGMYALNSRDMKMMGLGSIPIPGDLPNHTHTVTGTLKASYLVDITGRHYRNRQAALKEAAASREDAQAMGNRLATQIILSYYDVVAAKMRVALIEDQVETNEQLLELVLAQFNAGQASSLDVLQQRQQVNSKKAQLPLVVSFLEVSKRQLATLIGEESLDSLPEFPDDLPDLSQSPQSVSTDGLETRKPELRAAMSRLDALADRETVAKRTLLPTLALNGSLGYKIFHYSDTSQGDEWALGALLTIPIYQGGLNHANLAQARAAKRNAEYSLEDSLLQAKAAVQNALLTEREQANYLVALKAQNLDAERTVGEAKRRYLAGLSDYLNVLSSNGALQMIELQVVQARRDLLTARVNLLNALGGDWTRNIVALEERSER